MPFDGEDLALLALLKVQFEDDRLVERVDGAGAELLFGSVVVRSRSPVFGHGSGGRVFRFRDQIRSDDDPVAPGESSAPEQLRTLFLGGVWRRFGGLAGSRRPECRGVCREEVQGVEVGSS